MVLDGIDVEGGCDPNPSDLELEHPAEPDESLGVAMFVLDTRPSDEA